jgi:hypothetical protein
MKMKTPVQPWYGWQKFLFRFIFIFYCVFQGPWIFLFLIPKAEYVLQYYYEALDAITQFFNKVFFHITPASKPPNGNGDYPEQWMIVCTSLLLAVVGCIIWSLIDRKRKDYSKLNYWFCLGIRYTLILAGIQYGVLKMFALQMPFPNLSQMATPLGDYLPMRFSWMFIGYSHNYQFFSGAIEVLAAVLLLFRRTATLGVLVATGVFMNVMMLNLSYDIPVKINSISLVVLSLYLLVHEVPRLYRYFFHNEAIPSSIFIFPFETRKGRTIARVSKWLFVVLVLYNELNNDISRMNMLSKRKMPSPVTAGIYDIIVQTNKGDTITVNMPDSVYWQNIVFDRGYEGSIKTADMRFRQRYGRSYFNFEIDSASNLLSLKRSAFDSVFIAQFKYNFKDSLQIELYSYPSQDSMYLLLQKRKMPFPLSGRPFNWVSETNR